mmetsp:Transcript_107445/g.312433  ORF Transcript_107445/g.312433 Transcript_107445/m.312433 type:complete len:366 (-) Transcript_107445:70-1167(-)
MQFRDGGENNFYTGAGGDNDDGAEYQSKVESHSIQIDEDDGIVRIEQMGAELHLELIRFVTQKGKTLLIFGDMERYTFAQARRAEMLRHRPETTQKEIQNFLFLFPPIEAPEGKVLREVVKFDEYSGRIQECEWMEAERVPSLSTQAARASLQAMRAEAKACEDKHDEKCRVAETKARTGIDVAYKQARHEIFKCKEASRVSKLTAELADATYELRRKARALESRANETRERIQAKYDVDVARMARNRLKDRAEILANQQAVRASLEDQANLVTTVGNHPICHPSAKRLCSEPSCRLGFDPERVPAHKRCSVPSCASRGTACGCAVSACHRCARPICREHTGAHDEWCSDCSHDFDADSEFRDYP